LVNDNDLTSTVQQLIGNIMGKTVLQHMDSNSSVISYGNEDLAPYRDLPQSSTRVALTCMGAVTNNPLLSTTAPFRQHKFVMKIAGFSQRVGHKLVVKSTKATIDVGLPSPTKWCLLLYPNGNQEDREGFVSLYLYRWDKQTTPVPATFTFAILNSLAQKSFVVDVNEKKMFGHSAGNSKSLGAPKFVSRDDLFDSAWGLLQDDTLTVVCEMHVFTADSPDRHTSKKGSGSGGQAAAAPSRGIKFGNWVEELHYTQHPEEVDRKKHKGGNMAVGLFNPMRFLHSIETWKKEETEV